MARPTVLPAIATRWIAALLALMLACPAGAQDYAREKRWADEILPAVVVGDPVYLKASSGREFLGLFSETKGSRVALVLVHGVGVHPDHGVIGALRSRTSERGYTTLSIQMPVAAKEATVDDYYPGLFGDAADRIARAADWLVARGYTRIVLVSHSMGAWMANEYLDRHHATTPYKAWVAMGVTGGYSWTMRRYTFPVLDVYGNIDLEPVRKAADRRRWALNTANGSRQVRIAGADHFYDGKEGALSDALESFIRDTVAK